MGVICMIRYDDYKALTKSQKEEYDYRFRDKVYISNSGLVISSLVAFVSLMFSFVFIVYLIMIDDKFISLRDKVQDILGSVGLLSKLGMAFLLIILFVDLFNRAYNYFALRRWMKKNDIKMNLFNFKKWGKR
jgi:hypothetical protein